MSATRASHAAGNVVVGAAARPPLLEPTWSARSKAPTATRNAVAAAIFTTVADGPLGPAGGVPWTPAGLAPGGGGATGGGGAPGGGGVRTGSAAAPA